MVLQPDAPQISLSGVGPHLARPAPEFEGPRGVSLFPELRIVCSLSHAVNTAAQGMEGGGGPRVRSPDNTQNNQHFLLHIPSLGTFWFHEPLVPLCHLSALMSDAVAHTLDGCEVQPLGEELNPEREELLVDMDVVRERGLEIINTTAYIAITGNVHTQYVLQGPQ